MLADYTETKAKLRKLARRLHHGWAKLYPVTEQELDRVRRIVRTQWEKEQQAKQNLAEARQGVEKRSTVQEHVLQDKEATQQAKSKRVTKPRRDQDCGHSRCARVQRGNSTRFSSSLPSVVFGAIQSFLMRCCLATIRLLQNQQPGPACVAVLFEILNTVEGYGPK